MEQEREDRERIEQNARRTAGIYALRKIRGIVDEESKEEAARKKWLRNFLLYGWIILLLVALLLARRMGVI